MALLAGVSQSTVSYVMSGQRAVSAETQRRVNDAIAKLGYEPHAGAKALRGRKTNVIALAVHLSGDSDITDTAPYLDAVLEGARSRDYDVVLLTTDEGSTGLRRLAKRSICDAFVLMDIARHDERIPVAAELGMPVVMMGNPEKRHGLDAVDFNSRRAGELLAQHFVDTGHRHIAAVDDHGPISSGEFGFYEDFFTGAAAVATANGVTFERIPVQADGLAGVRQVAADVLRHRDDRLGLLGRSPGSVMSLLQLLELERLTPGEDVSLAGLLTDAVAERMSPMVTNVSPRPQEHCALAIDILFRRLGGDDDGAGMHWVQPDAVVERGSVRRY